MATESHQICKDREQSHEVLMENMPEASQADTGSQFITQYLFGGLSVWLHWVCSGKRCSDVEFTIPAYRTYH